MRASSRHEQHQAAQFTARSLSLISSGKGGGHLCTLHVLDFLNVALELLPQCTLCLSASMPRICR